MENQNLCIVTSLRDEHTQSLSERKGEYNDDDGEAQTIQGGAK